MAITVSDLIHSSFRLIGAIAAGEQLETDELDDAFVSLNQMLSSWNTEGASLVGRKQLVIPVSTALSNAYVLPERPVKIEAASVSTSNINCPLEIVDAAGWEAITEKGAQAIITRKLYCNYQYPTSIAYIWPVPRTVGQLEMWIYATIAQFTSLAETINLPQGYEVGLRYNFAVNIAPEYGRPLDEIVPALAQQFKASLVQLNASNHMRSQAQAPQQAAVQQVVT